MNFLDPNGWKDLEQLEKEHEELSEERVKHLHARLRPYFLRRTKKEVLKLPPKVSNRRHLLKLLYLPACRTKSLCQCLWHLCRKKFTVVFSVRI